MSEKYLSDIIRTEDIDRWRPRQIVTIAAGTDCGKSHFIKYKLADYARQHGQKILMLCHRTMCVKQFNYEIMEARNQDVISVTTYQKLEHAGGERVIAGYDYVVCDEFHYFQNDSEFNPRTDVSLERILAVDGAIKIFMSATGADMKRYIQKKLPGCELVEYTFKRDRNPVLKLNFLMAGSLEDIAERIIWSGMKGIFFINNTNKALALYEKYKKHAIFCCSETNGKDAYKYVNQNKVKQMLENKRIDEQLLITTTVLDAGVNFRDKSIKYIVLDVPDLNTMKQCVGRRRIDYNDPEDGVYVIVRKITNSTISHLRNIQGHRIKQAKYLKENGEKAFVEEYSKEGRLEHVHDLIYIDCSDENFHFKVNELRYEFIQNKIRDYEEMLETENGYIRKICKMIMDDPNYDCGKIYIDNDLESYLRQNEGEILYSSEDKNKIIELIGLRDKKGKLYKRIEALNLYLQKDLNMRYEIVPMKKTRYKDRDTGEIKFCTTPWKIEKTGGGPIQRQFDRQSLIDMSMFY